MWNPFTSPLGQSSAYESPQPHENRDDLVMPNVPDLTDAYTGTGEPFTMYGPTTDYVTSAYNASYAAGGQTVVRDLPCQPGQYVSATQSFLNPAPGSTDLIAARDSGGIPGTVELNVRSGPVTGSVMDVYGNYRQGLQATPPGYLGPVQGGTPQDQLASQAYFQQALSQYSNAASDQAMVLAV